MALKGDPPTLHFSMFAQSKDPATEPSWSRVRARSHRRVAGLVGGTLCAIKPVCRSVVAAMAAWVADRDRPGIDRHVPAGVRHDRSVIGRIARRRPDHARYLF